MTVSKAWATLAFFVLSSCASGHSSVPPQGLKIATAAEVVDCNFVSDVTGTSSFYGVFAGAALDDARRAAMNEATQIGADTLVWYEPSLNYGSTSITGQAFRCG